MPQLWVREVEVVASSTKASALRAVFTVEVEGETNCDAART